MNSGFSTVTKYLALGLQKKGHEISLTGMQDSYTSSWYHGIESLPLDTKYLDETSQFIMNIRRVDPDVVIGVFQADADMNHFTRIFDENSKTKFLWYPPVEGSGIPDGMVNDLKFVIQNGGKIVSQCFYGQSEMKKVGIDNITIYHGYNNNIYKPVENINDKNKLTYCYYSTDAGKAESDPVILCRQGCYDCCLNEGFEAKKCQYYKEETVSILRMMNTTDGKKWVERDIGITKLPDETKGKWVYGHVGQNFGIRKRQERLIKAYSILISESRQLKDKTLLHMHCMPMAVDGINLIKEIARLGISENVIFSYGGNRSNSWSEESMNILYNTFDCHVSASSSEGWGLPTGESMACGIPNIGPDCSSFTELIGNDSDWSKNRGWLANIGEWQMIQDGSYRALVDEKDLALKMKLAYVEKDKMKTFGENAVMFAGNYTWDKICAEFDKVLVDSK